MQPQATISPYLGRALRTKDETAGGSFLMTFLARQIFMDGRELPKDPQPTWLGYSIGR
jgi:hypothetical protein